MSVVIVGGNDRMINKYKELCKTYSCKAKIFTQMPAKFSNQIGRPDLIVLFTNTVAHKMVLTAMSEAEKNNIKVERSHSSSVSALKKILAQHC